MEVSCTMGFTRLMAYHVPQASEFSLLGRIGGRWGGGGGGGWGPVPPPPPPHESKIWLCLVFPPPKVNPTPLNNSCNAMKTSFLAVVIVPVPYLFLVLKKV